MAARPCSWPPKRFGRSPLKTLDMSTMERIETEPKHRYVYPLDAEMRERLKAFAQPYPKRPKVSGDEYPSSQGGSTPTRALQLKGIR